MSDSIDNIITGPWPSREIPDAFFGPHAEGNVSPIPRKEFGRRPRMAALADGLAAVRDELVRQADLDEQSRIKKAARAARSAADHIPPRVSAEEVIALSEMADACAQKARELAALSQRAAFLLLAQDAEQISERAVHLATEFQP